MEEYKSNTSSSLESFNFNAISSLRKYRNLNLFKLVLAYININSVGNKFDLFSEQIQGNLDVLMICENKIDDCLANGQLKLKGFNTLFRLNRDKSGGSIVIIIREDIATKLLLRYYATFRVRKFESFLYNINTCLQKTTTCIGLRAEKILSVNISYTYFSILSVTSTVLFLFTKAPASCCKKILNQFLQHSTSIFMNSKRVS